MKYLKSWTYLDGYKPRDADPDRVLVWNAAVAFAKQDPLPWPPQKGLGWARCALRASSFSARQSKRQAPHFARIVALLACVRIKTARRG